MSRPPWTQMRSIWSRKAPFWRWWMVCWKSELTEWIFMNIEWQRTSTHAKSINRTKCRRQDIGRHPTASWFDSGQSKWSFSTDASPPESIPSSFDRRWRHVVFLQPGSVSFAENMTIPLVKTKAVNCFCLFPYCHPLPLLAPNEDWTFRNNIDRFLLCKGSESWKENR